MRHDIRKRAMQCIEDLILILEKMNNVSSKPEKDFAKIFEDDLKYFKLLKTLDRAWRESYNKTPKLANPENWRILRIAAMEADISIYPSIHSEKAMADSAFRLDVMRKLQRKSEVTGIDYLKDVRKEIARGKMRYHYSRPRRNLVICVKCGHEQKAMYLSAKYPFQQRRNSQ